MNIGERLKALRVAKKFSQGDIEKRSGLHRSYLSRVENGHSIPGLETLQRWAQALEVEVYQLFFEGGGKPEPVPAAAMDVLERRERVLVRLFRQADEVDRQLMLDVARKMANRRV